MVVVAQILKFFGCDLWHLLKNWKTEKNWSRPVATGLSSHHVLDIIQKHIYLIFGLWIIKDGQELVEIWPKHFYTQLECRSLLLLPYLSQILTKLLETIISLQRIKISIYVSNECEVILVLSGTTNITTKDQLQPVWTGFFRVMDWLELVFKGLVAVPEYLKWSGPVAVASYLVLREKTGLNWTSKH